MGGLALVDLGTVPGVRSQTAWHAIAETMREGDDPVLCLCTPGEPYVSIGYHRRVDEVDAEECARRGIAIYRRRAGGGPVYCDSSQLFFQLIAPASSMPAVMDRAWRRAMEPAVEAFRALGAPAALVEGNDILARGRKISGTGAARLGDANVFVGNVIFSFDYDAMAACLRVPDGARHEAARLMRRFLAPVGAAAGRDVSPSQAAEALVAAYSASFGPVAVRPMNAEESDAAARLDALFSSGEWVAAERAALPARIKIRAGVAILLAGDSWISVVDGRIEGAGFAGGWVAAPGMEATLARALLGLPVHRTALSGALRAAGVEAERGDELVGAILDAYRGGA